MPRLWPLYRLLPVCVLIVAGCGGEEPENSRRPVVDRAQTEADLANHASRILVLGNSITAGFGLDPRQAYPSILQAKVDSAGYPYEVVNAGLSGETTAGGRRRIEWLLREPVDILIIELGGNDGLRGFDPGAIKENLLAIIEQARDTNSRVKVLLGGIRMPLNMGRDYIAQFESVFPEVARETGVQLIPHILEGVGGIRRLNQADGIHPTAEGQEIVAQTVWSALEPLLDRGA